MKKVLSLVLVLALVLGSFGMAFADTDTTAAAATTTTPKDVVGTDYEGAVTALSALGVVSGYEDGNYKPANIVTRAEMAKLIIAELGLTGNATGAKSTFTDLSGYGWAEGFIGYAQSLGIINGYGDGTFKPGQSVSYDEALTMIVSALGYTKDCKEMNGSWPAIYVQKARVLGLTDDVKAGGAVGANRGDIAIYLYNMLTANMGYADADGAYVEKKDKDGKEVKVISNLDAKESTDGVEGYSVITKADADDALVNIKPYVGACAKTFVMTKGKNDGKIIAISDVKSTFITGEYKMSDEVIKAADGTEYKLGDIVKNGVKGTSTEKFVTSQGTDYTAVEFWNGDTAKSSEKTILNDGKTLDTDTAHTDVNGTVVTIAADLSGKTVKGIYSVAKWTSDAEETVEADDLKDITSNKTLLGKDFTQDDNDNIDLTSFELIGVDSLSDIKEGHVVYVYTDSKEKEITRVAVGTEVVKGEITKISDSTTNAKITIGGKDYQLAEQKLANNGVSNAEVSLSDLDTEDEVELMLDAYGYAYDYNAISGSADNYAIVLKFDDKGDRMTQDASVKLFLADGSVKTFAVDDDLFATKTSVPGITDGSAPGTSNGNDTTFNTTPGAMVKYGVDKEGVIDTFEDFNKSNFDFDATPAFSDITKSGYYDGREIAKNAVIFSYEKDVANYTSAASINDRNDDDNYSTSVYDKILDTDKVDAVYVAEKNKIVAMLLLDYNQSDYVYGVATGYKKTSGDSDYEIEMIVNGETKKYPATTKAKTDLTAVSDYDVANVDAGNKLFKLKFNGNGELNELVQVFDGSVQDPDTISAGGITGVKAGDYAYDNRKLTISDSPAGTVVGDVQADKSYNLDRNATVYINDGSDFDTGSMSDLKNLAADSCIWIYDTEDDNNALFNYVVVYKKGTATTETPVVTGTIVKVATTGAIKNDVKATAGSIYAHAVNFSKVPKNEKGEPATAVTQIKASVGGVLTVTTDYTVFGDEITFTAVGMAKMIKATDAIDHEVTVTILYDNNKTTTFTFKVIASEA